ncbi:MAG: ABC transporter substrate-binding protein [Thaumarchaeota archaeon]|nr:ABC transporter substrate-binding protein [Candidatus Calditenuaceae archaeon]MDW8043166.1 ABC transporter substrate-binding protein [Nitrososphaerota archaeon]
MKKVVALLVVVAILAIVAGVLVTQPLTTPAPRPAEKIYVGYAFCLTGPFAGPAEDGIKGIRDYIRIVNERGGVNGREIVLLIEDNEYKPETTIRIFTRWKEQYKLSAFVTCGTHVVAAIYQMVAEARIPYSDTSMAGPFADARKYPWYFPAPLGSYTDHYRAFLKWFKDKWAGPRAPRLAIVWETKAFAPLVKPGVESYAKDLGYEVMVEVVEIGSTSALEQMQRIKAYNADVVATMLPPAETALVLRTAREVGLKAEFVNFLYSIYWEPLVERLGPLAEGTYFGAPFVPWGYDVPGMKDLLEAHRRFHPDDRHTTQYVSGWISAMVLVEALRRAGDDLSGENVRRAWESITNFDTKGLTPPLGFTPMDHRSTTTIWIWKIEGGKFVRVAEVTLPRDDGYLGK